MNCASHPHQELKHIGTDMTICPLCFKDRPTYIPQHTREDPAYGVIPLTIISPSELQLLTNPTIDGDRQEVRVDLSDANNAAQFLAITQMRQARSIGYDSIKKIDLVNRTITLKGDYE